MLKNDLFFLLICLFIFSLFFSVSRDGRTVSAGQSLLFLNCVIPLYKM